MVGPGVTAGASLPGKTSRCMRCTKLRLLFTTRSAFPGLWGGVSCRNL
jgi:hypothetical protein